MEGYYIHPLPVCHALFPDFDPLMNRFCIVILHKYLRFSHCSVRVYPICTLHITRYRDYFRKGTTYSVLSLQLRFFHLWKLQRRLVPLCDLLGCLLWLSVLLPGLYWGRFCHAIGGLSNKDQIRVGSCLIM